MLDPLGISGCALCWEVNSREVPEQLGQAYGLSCRFCYETQDFFVIPTVSPLVAGHALVLPRFHFTRFADIPVPQFFQLADCLRVVVGRLASSFGLNPYIFEHGVHNGGTACGIDHAHIHVVPLRDEVALELENRIAKEYHSHAAGSLDDVLASSADRAGSYLLHGRNLDSLEVSFSNGIPSQYMRKLIATVKAQSEWDWKGLYGRSDFLATHEALDRA